MALAKKHVLFINRIFPPDSGASALRLFEMVQALAQDGWRVTVLTNKGRNAAPDNLHDNVRLVRLPFGSADQKPQNWHYPFWILAFWLRALTLPRADVTVSLSDPPLGAMITAMMKPFKQTRIIHWVHDLYPQLWAAMGREKAGIQRILMMLSAWALKRHERIITLGDDMNAVLLRQNVKAEKLAIIPNWPDVQAALLDKNKPARHSSGNPFILEGVFTVLYSGNFGEVHDFEPLIEAMKIVQKTPHPIRFILAGDGSRFERVRDKIDQLFLTNVHFIRAQPKGKFIDMLLAGDVHVSTMVPEAVGLAAPSKINSALGLARPCLYIGPPKAFQAQLITTYKAGYVIDPTDRQAPFHLADAIIHLATNATAYEDMQKNALQAADSISFAKALEKFEAVLARRDKA